jgi:hypothetical protein
MPDRLREHLSRDAEPVGSEGALAPATAALFAQDDHYRLAPQWV